MKIAYGVHGYGRGHAMRSLAVAQQLSARHDVVFLAGQEAYEALHGHLPTVRIPNIGFHYNRRGQISNLLTLLRNAPAVLDARLGGATVEMVRQVLQDVRADLVISDSELFTLAAARRLDLPHAVLDHFGLLVFCLPQMGWRDRVIRGAQAWTYRRLYGSPEHVIVSGFFPARPLRRGVHVVGPILRAEFRRMAPADGEHLLVYISKGAHEYTPAMEQALAGLDCPVLLYGARRGGRCGNLTFKPFSLDCFLEDLAGCRAVVATTGNQLIGEVMHFEKPMLGMPIACLEQRLNAQHIERMGFGMHVPRRGLTTTVLQRFLDRCAEFKSRLRTMDKPDGAAQAVQHVERILNHHTATGPA